MILYEELDKPEDPKVGQAQISTYVCQTKVKVALLRW
jgi:hypothetical protein